jgi:hypothetical protein
MSILGQETASRWTSTSSHRVQSDRAARHVACTCLVWKHLRISWIIAASEAELPIKLVERAIESMGRGYSFKRRMRPAALLGSRRSGSDMELRFWHLTCLMRFRNIYKEAPMSINPPRDPGSYLERDEDCQSAIERHFLYATVNSSRPYVDLARVLTEITDEATAAGWSEEELTDAVSILAQRHNMKPSI